MADDRGIHVDKKTVFRTATYYLPRGEEQGDYVKILKFVFLSIARLYDRTKDQTHISWIGQPKTNTLPYQHHRDTF